MKKILLIEDDSLMVNMYKKKFLHDGFEVEVALDGVEGEQKVKQVKPDIIILDIMLPKMSGTDLLERIKKEPSVSSIPVLVLTNLNTNQEEVAKTLELGAKEILQKTDYTPQQVVDKIRKYLNEN